ncbi:putative transcriptional regulator [Streptococcus mutans KK23]|nr:putative transcriptional regulator [Streptococcus mutans KK23]
MISKGIFYAHYLDKYDLAEQLIDRKLKFFENLLFQRFQSFYVLINQ